VFSQQENNQKVYKQLGSFFMEKGNKELALDYYKTALDHEKDDFGLYREVIDLEADAGNFEQVKRLSQNGLEVFPNQAWLYLMLGTSHNVLNDFNSAEEALLLGLDYLIEDPATEKKFHRQLAITYSGLNQTQKAKEALSKAEKLKK